ncbi:MAG: methylglyoxal synthase [Clostridia bacterium]|nr:methylglyoxal synthase [Clostridia bacterium]
MEIAIVAHDTKKELMAELCISYCGILCKHNICATSSTAKYIADATGLEIERLLSGDLGGEEQLAQRISYNEIDLLIDFRDTRPDSVFDTKSHQLLRLCDMYNVPFATNLGSAEALIIALDRGDLDWRQFVNPKHNK